MKWIAIVAACLLVMGCGYGALYEEELADGGTTTLKISNSPFFGKASWNGQATIIVDASGAYEIYIGHTGEATTDLGPTLSLFGELFKAGVMAGTAAP